MGRAVGRARVLLAADSSLRQASATPASPQDRYPHGLCGRRFPDEASRMNGGRLDHGSGRARLRSLFCAEASATWLMRIRCAQLSCCGLRLTRPVARSSSPTGSACPSAIGGRAWLVDTNPDGYHRDFCGLRRRGSEPPEMRFSHGRVQRFPRSFRETTVRER